MLASVVPRIGALLAQRGVQAVATGLLSGVVVGAGAVAAGLLPAGSPGGATVSLLACPGSGTELARVSSGQTLLVTARSADGTWLQVYVDEPGIDRAWAPVAALRLQATAEGLPVADCGAPATAEPIASSASSPSPSRIVEATVVPVASPTPRPSPTTKPTARPKHTAGPTAVPVPTPTPAPDVTNPTVSGLHASPTCIGPDSASSTVSVTATDPDDPIDHVTMGYLYPGQEYWLLFNMDHAGGSVWQATFTYSSSMVVDGYVDYYAIAYDSHGNASASLGSDSTSIDNFIHVAPGGCTG